MSNTGGSPIYTLGNQTEARPDILVVDHQQGEEVGKKTEGDTQPPLDEENKENTMEANQEHVSLQSRLAVNHAGATGTVIGITLPNYIIDQFIICTAKDYLVVAVPV